MYYRVEFENIVYGESVPHKGFVYASSYMDAVSAVEEEFTDITKITLREVGYSYFFTDEEILQLIDALKEE